VCIIRGSNSGPFKWQKQTNKIYYVFFHPLDFMKHYKQEWIEKEKLFCKNNTQITVWQRKMKTQFLCVWHVKSFKRYLLLWKKNMQQNRAINPRFILNHGKSHKKVSKNAILKNIAKMAKNKWRILKKQSAAFWRKKQTKHKL